MNKVLVLGNAGSGKSTFSKNLGEILNLPIYTLDNLYFRNSWNVFPDREEFKLLVMTIIKEAKWIIDGNYMYTLEDRMINAEVIILLNIPAYLCFFRIIKRWLKYYGKVRPGMIIGCKERIDIKLLVEMFQFYKRKESIIIDKMKFYSTKKNIIFLNSPKQVNEFLQQLKQNIKK